MKQPDEVGRRSRRRPGSAEVSHAIFDRPRPYRHLKNPFTPLKVFSEDQVAAMHEAALTILETQGMKVLSDDARKLYHSAGAQLDESTQIVRVDRGAGKRSLARSPREINALAAHS